MVNIEKPACYLRKFSPSGKHLYVCVAYKVCDKFMSYLHNFRIAFSSDQASLEIYEFQGCAAATDLIGEDWTDEVVLNVNKDRFYDIRSKIFEKLFKVRSHRSNHRLMEKLILYFQLKHVVNMDGSEKQLNRECSLFCNDGKHVIVGAAIFISDDLRPNFYTIYSNNESITTVS